ncbi:hypothetical protein [Gordonia humi]|uniref:Glucan phosphorylase n=1 Tax=Gordonia humi TaxID=686429 RepID=A0A840FAT5_9ACTN|nr:hypothetical protein [Gordonia humi]MBB4137260.1 glucan phosphorylase [Gordonia humi]
MTTNKNLHPERVARLLAVAAATNALTDDVVSDAENIVELVDAGATRSKVTAAVQALVSEAWTRAAREAAAAEKPKAVKASMERLRGVAELEDQLGLAPVENVATVDADPEPESTPESDPDLDMESVVNAAVAEALTDPDPYSNYDRTA